MGTGSAFFLYNLEDFDEFMDVFDNWNSITIVPSLGELESDLYTKMSKEYLGEEWLPYKEFNLDDEYHKYEIEWTP